MDYVGGSGGTATHTVYTSTRYDVSAD